MRRTTKPPPAKPKPAASSPAYATPPRTPNYAPPPPRLSTISTLRSPPESRAGRRRSPNPKPTFSASQELAELAEARDQLDLAASGYRAAFDLQSDRKAILLELARVEKARNNPEGEIAALFAASRGGEPRAAELARERLPDRYPYVYEFRKALEIDPKNDALHRELAWLLLRMSEKGDATRLDAEHEFQALIDTAPDDYLATVQLGLLYLEDHDDRAQPLLKLVLAHADAATANRARMALHMPLVLEDRQSSETALDPRILGERSYNAGFMKDALRYYTARP